MATVKEKDFLHSLDKRTAILEEILIRLETNHLAFFANNIYKNHLIRPFHSNWPE